MKKRMSKRQQNNLIVITAIMVVAFSFVLAWSFSGGSTEKLEKLLPIFMLYVPIGLFAVFVLIKILYPHIKKKLMTINMPDKVKNVVDKINEFEPSRNWGSEEGYQAELQGWLKREFPHSKVEVQTGASRPDLIISNIAIEVKGPTTDEGINSLPAKCIKYSKHYDQLIIVLFRPQYSKRNYNDIMEGINKMFPSVIVIEK